MKPANTKEMWAQFSDPRWPDGEEEYRFPRGITEHGAAAWLLFGQPFGFTREDAEWLRKEATENWDEKASRGRETGSVGLREWGERNAAMARSLADRIEALLPPE